MQYLTFFVVLAFPLATVSADDSLKQLVLDDRVIKDSENAELVLGQVEKHPDNPLMRADKPWENSLNNLYPNVAVDEQTGATKLWYKCMVVDQDAITKMGSPPTTNHPWGWYLLYATSQDGLKWEKPELGLVSYDGSTKNNIVARDTANVGVFEDPRPDADRQRRYKMIYDIGVKDLMRVRFSPDGLRWSEPRIPTGLDTGDTHNNAFWDARIGKYVLITRWFRNQRLVVRSESDDFLNWTPPQLILRSLPTEGRTRQTYCMPAFRYGNVYLGYVMMYNAQSDRVVDCELAWSPDGLDWRRVKPGEAIIPRGPAGSYDAGCIYGPAGPAIVRDGKLWIYYGGSREVHAAHKRHCELCLATLRPDGFAGYRAVANGQPATVMTQPLLVDDEVLKISADVEQGSVRVSVVGVEGYGLNDCQPLTTDATDQPITWQGGKTLANLRGKVVQLQFELRNATLYSFHGLRQHVSEQGKAR